MSATDQFVTPVLIHLRKFANRQWTKHTFHRKESSNRELSLCMGDQIWAGGLLQPLWRWTRNRREGNFGWGRGGTWRWGEDRRVLIEGQLTRGAQRSAALLRRRAKHRGREVTAILVTWKTKPRASSIKDSNHSTLLAAQQAWWVFKGDDLHTCTFAGAQGQPLRQRGVFQHRVPGRQTDAERISHVCLSRGQRGGLDAHCIFRGAFRSRTQSGRLSSGELKGGLILWASAGHF